MKNILINIGKFFQSMSGIFIVHNRTQHYEDILKDIENMEYEYFGKTDSCYKCRRGFKK